MVEGPDPARKRTRGLRLALIALVAILVVLELVVRFGLFRVSKDLRRFRDYPSAAVSLAESSGTKIALFGNSTTDRGIDLAMVDESMEASGSGPAELRVFVADSSEISTWYFLIKHYFWDKGLKPDLAVLSFYGIDLADQSPEIGRLAQNFTSIDDWSEVYRTDLTTSADRVDFAISSVWATFSARDRIRDRVLDIAIPHYRDFTRRLNDEVYKHQKAERTKGGFKEDSSRPSYRVLARTLSEARRRETKLVFVALPIQVPAGEPIYPIAPEVQTMLEDAGVPLIDFRTVDGLDNSLYEDDIHLNPAGRQILSRKMGEALAAYLSRSQ